MEFARTDILATCAQQKPSTLAPHPAPQYSREVNGLSTGQMFDNGAIRPIIG